MSLRIGVLRPILAAVALLALGSGWTASLARCGSPVKLPGRHGCCCQAGAAHSAGPARSPMKCPRNCCTVAPQAGPPEATLVSVPPQPSLAAALPPVTLDPIAPTGSPAASRIRSGDPPGTPAQHTVLRI